jgi:dipeptidyl aminopeptidase/acylaminoacyl peptidase
VAALALACTRESPEVEPSSPGKRLAPAAATVAPAPQPAALAGASSYKLPPPDVVALVDGPATPEAHTSPDGARVLLARPEPHPSIATVARPFARLAGNRIDTARSAMRRTRFYDDLSLLDVASAQTRSVTLPEGLPFAASWSPDGARIAVTIASHERLDLVVIDAGTATSTVVASSVTDVLGPVARWLPGSQELIVRLIPPQRGAPPPAPVVPDGPIVEETSGRAAQNRTWQDLLRGPHDEALFEHYATVQLARVGTGEAGAPPVPIGPPGTYDDVVPSPSGEYLLVVRVRRPYSYAVPVERFARVVEIWDRDGTLVHTLDDQNAAEDIPIEGVRTGPRMIEWVPNRPHTLAWAEALDGGDPKKEVPHRDKLLLADGPAWPSTREVAKVQHRLSRVDWLERGSEALLSEYDRDRRWTTTWHVDVDAPAAAPKKLFDRSVRDAYSDPGDPVHRVLANGHAVVRVDDGAIFLRGEGATPQGDRPFLDRFALDGSGKERLLSSPADAHAEFVAFVTGKSGDAWLVRRESPDVSPDLWVSEGGSERQLTHFPDPQPQLRGVGKKILKYARQDGVELSGTLYTPPGWKPGTRLPLVVWAYPLEYNDKDTAGQVRAAPNRYTRATGTSPLTFLAQGYAVLDGAAMPVVGHPETMNDTLLAQLVMSAQAAIDAAVAEGVADPDRVGVGGHSYGAFMTANLLAHSDLFRAGIARSGAYNRTLTPFGYQSERRTLWEAPQTYVNVSPLVAADKLDEPILLVHGEVDDNSGTFPLQTERLFHALKGTGGTARWVVLPHEAHGYAARESVLHVLAEQIEWFDKHVKNAKPRGGVAVGGG